MSQPSYFERATGTPISPVWAIRGFAIAIAAALALALFVFKQGAAHNFCGGMALGLTIGLLAQTFAIGSVTMKDNPQPTDVEPYPLTR